MFVLINESHTETYRAQLGEEVGPQILELIERGEKGIKHLEKKAVLLKSKVLNTHTGLQLAFLRIFV